MNKDVQVVVVTPDAALGKKAVACPVIYLLHGYGGNAKTWIGVKPDLPQIADEKGIIFVCPDGKNSWYWDSPKDPSYRYETFVSSELVKYIDGHYKTIADRKGRAITGVTTTTCTSLFMEGLLTNKVSTLAAKEGATNINNKAANRKFLFFIIRI